MKDIDLLHQIDFFDDSGSKQSDIATAPGADEDKEHGFLLDDVVITKQDDREFICIDDKQNNAKWAYIVSSEDYLKNISGDARNVFVQENQTLWEFSSPDGQWFLTDNNLHKRGIMKIDEVWNRPYNKIPDGYVQFIYGLIVPDDIELEVDGELIDLKERI